MVYANKVASPLQELITDPHNKEIVETQNYKGSKGQPTKLIPVPGENERKLEPRLVSTVLSSWRLNPDFLRSIIAPFETSLIRSRVSTFIEVEVRPQHLAGRIIDGLIIIRNSGTDTDLFASYLEAKRGSDFSSTDHSKQLSDYLKHANKEKLINGFVTLSSRPCVYSVIKQSSLNLDSWFSFRSRLKLIPITWHTLMAEGEQFARSVKINITESGLLREVNATIHFYICSPSEEAERSLSSDWQPNLYSIQNNEKLNRTQALLTSANWQSALTKACVGDKGHEGYFAKILPLNVHQTLVQNQSRFKKRRNGYGRLVHKKTNCTFSQSINLKSQKITSVIPLKKASPILGSGWVKRMGNLLGKKEKYSLSRKIFFIPTLQITVKLTDAVEMPSNSLGQRIFLTALKIFPGRLFLSRQHQLPVNETGVIDFSEDLIGGHRGSLDYDLNQLDKFLLKTSEDAPEEERTPPEPPCPPWKNWLNWILGASALALAFLLFQSGTGEPPLCPTCKPRISEISYTTTRRSTGATITKTTQKFGGGLDHPPCWTKANGQPVYLFDITLAENGLSLSLTGEAKARKDLPSLPIASPQVLNKSFNPEAFRTTLSPILLHSQNANPECRHFVRIHEEHFSSNEEYKAQRTIVESLFYIYRSK